MLSQYGYEFLLMATAHLLAVMSPGPDFAVVSRHAISFGRRCALFTSVGVGCAIMVHIGYTLVGIGLLISQTPWVFDIFKFVAAAYLCYIGWGALQSPKPAESEQHKSHEQQFAEKDALAPSDRKSFVMGFMTNGLNPKATLFFLSLFTVIVAIDTPMEVKVFYGIYMSIATAAWFCFLSIILTLANVRGFFLLRGYLFDRIMGIILILLAIKLVFSSI